MMNRRALINRLRKAHEAGIPITNYGIAISFLRRYQAHPRIVSSALLAFQTAMRKQETNR